MRRPNFSNLACANSNSCAVFKKLRNGACQLGRAPNEGEGFRTMKLFRDGREVFHVRAHDDRLAEIRRLQNVVTAAHRQRASHEDNISDVKEGRELADGIQQQDSRQG